jgi:hypothetical protein
MTDIAGPLPASRQPHHKRHLLLRTFEFGWLVFPVILLCAIYFVPALQARVGTFPVEHASDLPWALLGMTLAAFVWLIVDFFVISNLNTSVSALRINTFASIALALGLSFYAGFAWHALTWGYIVPWIASLADAFITGDRAINNAAQKPLIQTARGG